MADNKNKNEKPAQEPSTPATTPPPVVSTANYTSKIEAIKDIIFGEDYAALRQSIQELNDRLDRTAAAIQARIDEEKRDINTRVDTEKAALNARMDTEKRDINSRVDSEKATLNARMDAEKAAINERVDREKAFLDDKFSGLLDELERSLNNRIDNLEMDLKSEIDRLDDHKADRFKLGKALEDIGRALQQR